MGAEKETCACPSCHNRYQVPEALKGKTVSCKKCGVKFQLACDAAGAEEKLPQKTSPIHAVEGPAHERDEIEEVPKDTEGEKFSNSVFGLTVSEDKLEAHIYPAGEIPDEISLGDIKKLLALEGIEYGVVDDPVITEYLKNRPIQKEPWKIAEGKKPGPARLTEVKYYFNTNRSKIDMSKGGTVDLKDRGKIPHVKEGDIIAQKFPGTAGTGGMDVFGHSIPAHEPNDIKLQCGEGAKESEDGLKALAKIDGLPKISADGKLLVLPGLDISGDVGIETGNIDFAGNINITGAVQNGFSVRGGSLSAKEILRAEIEVEGDIVVSGGIIGANIKTSGSISAKYVNGADITARGDIVVEKGLLNCKIVTSGACLVKTGKILSSSVSAKNGIEAKEIGSDKSRPCSLVVGLDERTRNEIARIEEQVALKREEQKKPQIRVFELQKESESLNKEIEELAKVQVRATQTQGALEKKIEAVKKTNNAEQLARAEKLFKSLDATISQNEKKLKPHLDKQDQIAKELTSLQDEIKDSEEEIRGFLDEIESVSKWSQQEKGVPVVKVYGTIFSQTTIRGSHCSVTLKSNDQYVSIRETKVSAPGSAVEWNMRFLRLR